MMQAFANFILSGRLQAILVAALAAIATTWVPPYSLLLSYFGAAVVALVTLRLGASQGLLVLAGAIAVAALVSLLTTGQALPPVVSAMLLWWPCWMLALVLRQTVSLGMTLQAAGLMGIFVLMTVYLLHGDPGQWWLEQLSPFEAALEQHGTDLGVENAQALIEEVSRLMTGAVVAAMMLAIIGSLLLARWWQGIVFNPGGFREEFHGLRFPSWLGLVTVTGMLVAQFNSGLPGAFSAQAALVLLVLYLFAGLAVAHALAANYSSGRVILIVLYLLLLFVPHVVMLLAAVGLLDTWLDFRTRFGKPVEK